MKNVCRILAFCCMCLSLGVYAADIVLQPGESISGPGNSGNVKAHSVTCAQPNIDIGGFGGGFSLPPGGGGGDLIGLCVSFPAQVCTVTWRCDLSPIGNNPESWRAGCQARTNLTSSTGGCLEANLGGACVIRVSYTSHGYNYYSATNYPSSSDPRFPLPSTASTSAEYFANPNYCSEKYTFTDCN